MRCTHSVRQNTRLAIVLLERIFVFLFVLYFILVLVLVLILMAFQHQAIQERGSTR